MKYKKLSLFLLIVIAIGFPATALQAQDHVTKDYLDSDFIEILSDIEHQFSVKFFYRKQWLPNNKIDIQFYQLPLNEALDSLFSSTGLSYFYYGPDKIVIGDKSKIDELKSGKNNPISQIYSTQINLRFPVVEVGDSTLGVDGVNQVSLNLYNHDEGYSLSGVSVHVEKLYLTNSTDVSGKITLDLPVGIHQIEFRLIGYHPSIVNLKVYSSGETTISMLPEAIELEEVVVSGDNPGERIRNPQTGIVLLTPKEIKEMPVFLGEADIIKTIQTIPGVTTIGEGAPGFFCTRRQCRPEFNFTG